VRGIAVAITIGLDADVATTLALQANIYFF
jgi:hypothetical protein